MNRLYKIAKHLAHTWKGLYLTRRFFQLFAINISLFVLSFLIPPLFPLAKVALALSTLIVLYDTWQLFRRPVRISGQRQLPNILSLGSPNTIYIHLQSQRPKNTQITIIDELPPQCQRREFSATLSITPGQKQKISYTITPPTRGEYTFGTINTFLTSSLGLIQRRCQFGTPATAAVYPSIIQMKQFSLHAFGQVAQSGLKKLRRIGHSYEFEQIKQYVKGDDYRSINWKASSRQAQLMVNQYGDERAQQVYCIIDKSRSMRMPFHQLSLMDYAINTSLVISNAALQKHDRAGLLTFSNKLGTIIKAENRPRQLNKIMQALYKAQGQPLEANYQLLYYATQKLIKNRSLLFLFTNFESTYALQRTLPILRRINQRHLLVVVFFKNTEITHFAKQPTETIEGIYHQTLAQKFMYEKQQMANSLKQYGIQALLTKPESLSMDTLNKYLELKSRGLI